VAEMERFNPYHGKAGSGHGGQFTSASGGSGGAAAKAPAHAAAGGPPAGNAGSARKSLAQARRRQLAEKIHADEARIRLLERELHSERAALHSSAAQAAHHKAQAAAAHKAGHVAKHRHHVTHHHRHHRRSVSHRDRIAGLEHQIGKLRAQVKALRGEMAKLPAVSRTSHTAEASTVHEPLGRPGGPGLFHHKGLQLPAYIQHVAHHLVAQGHTVSQAIEMAVGIVRNWAHGHDGHGNRVHPDVQAAAVKAMAQWEADKARGSKVRRSAVTEPAYDTDGLDASWDGDLDDLPDLAGLDVADLEALDPAGDGGVMRAMPKLGSGARFKALKAKLAAKGASNPGALAAYIGRRKFGRKKFAALAGKARGGSARRAEIFRDYPLEDYHLVRTADGDSSGRVIEAYATAFGEPAVIRDHQGHYEEEIDPAAFNKRIADVAGSSRGFAGVKVFYNHGMTIHGSPSDRFSMPVAVCESIRAEARGPITRSRYLDTPLGNEVLEMWRSGAITAQSFTGAIIRSSPELGPGQKYYARNGQLQRVRRLELGLREYGPTPFPAYQGAELVGVRMSPLGAYTGEELEEEALPPDEEAAPGGPPELHPSRDHAHRLLVTRMEEMCHTAGLRLPGRDQ